MPKVALGFPRRRTKKDLIICLFGRKKKSVHEITRGLQKEEKVSSGVMLIASFFLPRRREDRSDKQEEIINNTHQFPLRRQTEKGGDLIFSIFGTYAEMWGKERIVASGGGKGKGG